jgi:hypothetical protein
MNNLIVGITEGLYKGRILLSYLNNTTQQGKLIGVILAIPLWDLVDIAYNFVVHGARLACNRLTRYK